LLLYYITDRSQFPGSERARRAALMDRIVEAARCGVDFIQLREKDLSTRELENLARAVIERVREKTGKTRVLINSRTDVALAVGADGVHLRSRDFSPPDVRRIWSAAGAKPEPAIAVSCHMEQEVLAATQAQATFAVFGPVFEKSGRGGTGIDSLRSACRGKLSVLALGGVNAENAKSCVDAGAAGVAAIRLFQQGELEDVLAKLRA
jgi:thiamine-phosphate pyrophosphorylase